MSNLDNQHRTPDDITAQIAGLTQRLDEVLGEVRGQRDQLTRLARAYTVDAEQLDRVRAIADTWKIDTIEAHVRDVVAAAPVLTDPFPHVAIDPLLPPEAFNLLLEAVPAEEFFVGERHLDIKLQSHTILPRFSMAILGSLTRNIVSRVLGPALAQRFRPFASQYFRASFGEEFVEEALALPLNTQRYRLMLRRPGWTLKPHLDPRQQFITTLLYLGRPGDPETYGTQLFRVHGENFSPSKANTYYPEDEGFQCELVKTMPFRGNLCLSFLNLGAGAHGATVPADAQPAGLERRVFQFYMGPRHEALEALIDRLPAERQVAWRRREKKKDLRAMQKGAAADAAQGLRP